MKNLLKTVSFRNKTLGFYWYNDKGKQFLWVVYGNKYHNAYALVHWLAGKLEKLRGLFPKAYAIGLRDCDSGGRVCQWCFAWAWGDWDKSFAKRWNGAGDGEVYRRISFVRYLRAIHAERKEEHT